MLVTCVVSAIVCSVIYGLVRVRMQNWLGHGGMDGSSSKRRAVTNDKKRGSGTDNRRPVISLDLTDDDDEDNLSGCRHKTALRTMNTCGLDDTNHCNTSVTSNNYEVFSRPAHSSQSSVFLDTTDSLESEEEDKSILENALLNKLPKPLFRWDKKPKEWQITDNGTIDLTDDSDSPGSTHRVYTNKGKSKGKNNRKGKKGKNVENKGSLFSIFKTEEDVPQYEEKPEKIEPDVTVQCELTIAGVRVKLPVNPYPSQKAVMGKVIQGCVKQQHALLESPTGSGKTLALLCGALAWQDHFAAELEKERQKNLYGDLPKDCGDDEDYNPEAEAKGGKASYQVPKIFYGTRTHRQIEQVIRELNKTAYRFKKMTILSSREHTCIREEDGNKTELCERLLDPAKPGHCEYYTEHNKKVIGTFSALSRFGLSSAWDIEDLNRLGRKYCACPYFAARTLMGEADIIFCPYNYLLDPDIRDSVQLNLTNQVIILDEAHNIEDTCRDAASVELREDHMTYMAHEFKDLAKSEDHKLGMPVFEILMNYGTAFARFLKLVEVTEYNNKGDYACSVYWNGKEAIQLFNIHKIGVDSFTAVIDAGRMALLEYQRTKESMRDSLGEAQSPIMSQMVKRHLEHLLFALKMLQSEEHVEDYRVCVTETTVKDFKPQPIMENTWYSTDKRSNRVRALKMMCMNPGVTFGPLAKSARTIVLASGTLSPTTSFESELGTPFPQMLNANHVIHKDQIYATWIPKGPTGISLKATYQNVNQFTFQDELGRILLDVCESVPHGVLVFFSSYHMMNTQITRWRGNGTWDKISEHKQIFMEPRYAGDLAQVMNEYRGTIEETAQAEEGEIRGALLLAVFRGKVAEGIDFSDDEARCVITVGIPFAVANDPIVKMKMEYNRTNASKGLLNHNEWYTIQAFRALNQALGRCIRHKNDWGAVLMIDERFLLPEYNKNLPKWIKSSIINNVRYNLKEELRHFVAKQAQRDTKNKLQIGVDGNIAVL